MMRNLLFLLTFVPITACAGPDMEAFTPPPLPNDLQGNIQVDPHNPNGGKKFQGVWLVTSNGQKKLLAYNTQSIWAQFDGKSVHVTGADYVPDGQAYSATHYRIDSLKVNAPQNGTLFLSVGPKKTMKGTLTLEKGTPGSKMADETWWVFQSNGMTYQILNPKGWRIESPEVTLEARRVERSPFTAHMTGPSLWVDTLRGGHTH